MRFASLAFVSAALATSVAQARDLVPVIFAPGMGLPSESVEYDRALHEFFKPYGFALHVAQIPSGGTIEARSEQLYKEIQRLLPEGPRFHIVAHSMGGLDSRRMIQRYNLGARVISLTTVSTPHRGTAIADAVIGEDRKLDATFLRDMGEAALDMTTWNMVAFNERVPDDPRVSYFSLGYYIPWPTPLHTLSPLDWYTWKILSDAGKPANDGMVDVDSARWGTDLGSFPGAHSAEIHPILYDGHFLYFENFDRILKNLRRRFPARATATR